LGESKLSKHRPEMLGCFGSMNCSNELTLRRRSSNSSLDLGLAGNSSASKTKNKTSDRSTSLQVRSMGCINKADELKQRRSWKDRKT
jgi:hypothetical protein